MNKQDTEIIERTAKTLKESDLTMECIISELGVIYLTGKAAESRERLEEFRLAELEDKATCHHGFLVGCPTCHR